MDVSGQLHTPAALIRVTHTAAVDVVAKNIISASTGNRTPAVQPVVTDIVRT